MEARRLVITGLVQGVGFRHHMSATARQLGISGWVCNRSDRSVEAVIVGHAQTLAQMIDWASRGPPDANVAQVYVEEVDPLPQMQGFNHHLTTV